MKSPFLSRFLFLAVGFGVPVAACATGDAINSSVGSGGEGSVTTSPATTASSSTTDTVASTTGAMMPDTSTTASSSSVSSSSGSGGSGGATSSSVSSSAQSSSNVTASSTVASSTASSSVASSTASSSVASSTASSSVASSTASSTVASSTASSSASSTASSSVSSTASSSVASSSSGTTTCTELTAGTFIWSGGDGTYARYDAQTSPNIGTATPDYASVSFWGPVQGGTGDATGTFNLASGTDNNFSTCSQCVLLLEDATTMGSAKVFFQSSGSMTVSAGSDQLNGTVSGSLTNVTLVEVTLDPTTSASTPVPGGQCVHIASATISAANVGVVPPAWACNPSYFGDGDCDCGCGFVDIDCVDADSLWCDFCADPGSCSLAECGFGDTIASNDNAACAP